MTARHLAPVLVVIVALSGCATSSPSPSQVGPSQDSLSSQSTESLWSQLSLSSSAVSATAIEPELASRSEFSRGTEYLGRLTSFAVGRTRYARISNSGDRNCSDFASSAEAQKLFLRQRGPAIDPHGLDRDGDGFACEFGAVLQSSATRYRASTYTAPVRSYAPSSSARQCFTGPRGGTYTITSSGRKNYGGC
jgi:hypothetical protein